MNDELRQRIVERLKRGGDLPREWAREIFPPERMEYELVYHGKESESDILANTMAVPLQEQQSRTFGRASRDGWRNMLILGDNLQVLKRLIEMKREDRLCNADGTPGVRLVYIDPPFATRQEFQSSQEAAYRDKITGAAFVEFLRKRLVLLHEVLSPDGCIYVHLDYRKVHYAKVVLDEIFGEQNLVNEIVWQRTASHNDPGRYGCVHDTLLLYRRGPTYVWNEPKTEQSQEYIDRFFVYAESPDGKQWVRLGAGESAPAGWERYRLGNLASPHPRPNLTYEYRGYPPPANGWKVKIERMRELDAQGLLHFPATKEGRIQTKQYLRDTLGNKAVSDVWLGIDPLQAQSAEKQSYPTQKPEALLARIVAASSGEGDLVLDCFAGSGTTLAVAEKLGRRWIGIDRGKLAIYTIQRRMLTLRRQIGNQGAVLAPKPFALYNAGLYDFATLRDLPREDWRFFALQLFECRDEPHVIGGMKLDGKRRGGSVLVYNHHEHPGAKIDEEAIRSIHRRIGDKLSRQFFIIAPRHTFAFQQDYIQLDDVRYYALRIPYSFIHELHRREFSAMRQPQDETAVNDLIDAEGFDFIQPPTVRYRAGSKRRNGQMFKEAYIKLEAFESQARVRGTLESRGMDAFSMVLLDLNYDGKVFQLHRHLYAKDLEACDWHAWFPAEAIGEKVMAVFMDIYGNEAGVVLARADFRLT